MEQLEYRSPDPLQHLPHQEGLIAWGIVLIVFGSLAGVMAGLILFVDIFMMSRILPNSSGQNTLVLLSAVLVYVLAAVALIWLGIGSRTGKRWVRPLMIVGATLTGGWGLFALIPMTLAMISLAQYRAGSPGAVMGMAFGGCFVLVIMLAFPLTLLWFYGRPSVQATLDQMDPQPRWTDACPLPVLGWSITCVVCGAGFLFSAIKGIYPFFNIVLVGWPADGLALTFASLLIIGGIFCYRLRSAGWLTTFIAVVVMAVSMLTFALLGDHQKYLQLVMQNMSPPQQQFGQDFALRSLIASVIMYFGGAIYALWIRKWFRLPLAD